LAYGDGICRKPQHTGRNKNRRYQYKKCGA